MLRGWVIITNVCFFSRNLWSPEGAGEPTICFLNHEPRVVLPLDLPLPGSRHELPREALLACILWCLSPQCPVRVKTTYLQVFTASIVQCFKLLLPQTLHSNSRLSPASSRGQAPKSEMPSLKIRVCTVDLSPVWVHFTSILNRFLLKGSLPMSLSLNPLWDFTFEVFYAHGVETSAYNTITLSFSPGLPLIISLSELHCRWFMNMNYNFCPPFICCAII